ncbi:MAG: DUF5777 family beta-barrel protein [Bacteroidetes bacterium]|nr:DUF5777 family beta-barrel protein [Bacteroidota bacterium]
MRIFTIVTGKQTLLCLLFFLTGAGLLFGQDSTAVGGEKKPLAKTPFESGYFIADQTVAMPPAKTLELIIQHDFGTIQNGWTDLAGLWGASNIRFGLNFTITKNLMIGLGTTKNKTIQDGQIKYTFAHQRVDGFPLTIGYYGNMALNCTNKSVFGNNYKFTDRFSFFHELMIARRFGKRVSLQLGVAYVHYNTVDSTMKETHKYSQYKNDNINISGIGRLKVTPQTSIILSYSQPVMTYLNTTPWPNFGVGVEISTSTHCFQIFLTSAQGLVPQETVMYNNNNPYNGAILLGFNISRLWSF